MRVFPEEQRNRTDISLLQTGFSQTEVSPPVISDVHILSFKPISKFPDWPEYKMNLIMR